MSDWTILPGSLTVHRTYSLSLVSDIPKIIDFISNADIGNLHYIFFIIDFMLTL